MYPTIREVFSESVKRLYRLLGNSMGEGFWTLFCTGSECSNESGNECSSGILAIINPNSCINNVVVIAVDILLLFILLCFLMYRIASKKIIAPSQPYTFSTVSIVSVIFNAGLALAYLGLGIWIIIEKVDTYHTVLPLHGWLVYFFQGFTWLGLGFTINLSKPDLPHYAIMKFFSIFGFLIAFLLCGSSVWEFIMDETLSVLIVLNILCFPGSVLLLFSAFEGSNNAQGDLEVHDGDACYTPLPGAEQDITGDEISSDDNVTHFAKAGLFSKMTFWWLNPLMKKGKEKILENEDIPQLREADRARTLHSVFKVQLQKRKERHPSSSDPSVLTIIFFCQWKAILVSGFFALLKILAMTVSPLFLIAFIKVVDADAASRYDVYALTAGLFFVKIVESLSERQWFFRTRLIGLQVRSLISAAVYQKQLRLSNAAKMTHSPGDIVNYVTVDAYRIGEFPFWFHQIWSTNLQLFLSLLIIYFAVGAATLAALTVLILTVVVSSPLAKLQHEYQTKFMTAQNKRLRAITEALSNMKILKLYSWETNFKKVIEGFRAEELNWIAKVLSQKGYCNALFWTAPILAAAVTFWTCYFLGFTLTPSNVFTFLATLRILQEPIRLIPDVFGAFIEAKVSFSRIVKFLDAPELENRHTRKESGGKELEHSIFIIAPEISWDTSATKATLRDINLVVKPGEKVAICGEVGSGKSTLLAAILGEVPRINGVVQVYGTIAYVSQSAWIQTGTIQDNILFGSPMDHVRYREILQQCSLIKDLEILPFCDLTQIGERGVNLSGGQKQRIQLARALYQNAEVYLLDDPFSAVDAHTATSLFNEYVMGALAEKTVLLVTHQVDFLPAFNSILLMSSGKISRAAPYNELLASCQEFQDLVNAHNDTAGSERQVEYASTRKNKLAAKEIEKERTEVERKESSGDQLIKKEERETGDTGFKPYIQYLKHSNGFMHFSLSVLFLFMFIVGQLIQNYWLALNLQDYSVSRVKLFTVYSVIFCIMSIFLLFRSFMIVDLGYGASESIFSALLNSLFRAPMLFYDSTPVGRILSRVSTDMNIIDLEVGLKLAFAAGAIVSAYSIFLVLVVLAWPLMFLIAPTIYLTYLFQNYYFASAKELMRMNGTTKSAIASQLSESIAGAMTIRAFGQEKRLYSINLDFVDANSSADFNSFSTNEWLTERLEFLCAIVLSASAIAITWIDASSSGFIGMTLSYGLSLNVYLVTSVQLQCMIGNSIVSVERVEQYMHIPSESAQVIEDNRPAHNWPLVGKVEICDLKVRYRPNSPLVLRGINCIIEGGSKIGIVGRTGSGKTTLISVLFRLVEPTEGKVIVDDYDICTIGIHDLRSRLGIIPQEPTLFSGSVRFNLDPLSEHTDLEIWEVLEKCQLREAIQEKEEGLDSFVEQDGTNWSTGQRQLFCLGRALLKKSRILVLDEATASMDNATDSILQKTIRKEFADSTVITVAHRIPTVMDCTKVLAISDGLVVEYDEPTKLINNKGSLFGQLVKEYWSRSAKAGLHSED
ncbi:PREDICTED: ABC transporter C family member 10-like isoform X1 [Fragaria vesca subsp. vesca]|uniref:ABC transporter C family member 10-like isoform X1 n=1 Tax=Fragaria vesca subsp. vesca TaxID=101020 RepID=UPI0002C3379D|nr:PREDICTED: ABC transporter C family member 10-like isoform X1 [Fragaria vesca subsp. vesca]